MKKLTIIISLLSIWFFNVSVNAQEKQGPTLEQTLKFIQLNTHLWYSEIGDKDLVLGLNGLIVKDRILYASQDDDKYNRFFAIQLDQVEEIRNEDGVIILKSTKLFCEMKQNYTNGKVNYVKIRVTNSENVEKVVKAFKHLLDLYGIKLDENLF